jgi:hypothetical protein
MIEHEGECHEQAKIHVEFLCGGAPSGAQQFARERSRRRVVGYSRNCQGSLYLRLSYGRQLPGAVLVLRRPEQPRLQGALQRCSTSRVSLRQKTRRSRPPTRIRRTPGSASISVPNPLSSPSRPSRRNGTGACSSSISIPTILTILAAARPATTVAAT